MRKILYILLSMLLILALVMGCAQIQRRTPPKEQTEDKTENPVEDKKDAQLGEDKPEENKQETYPKEAETKGPSSAKGIKDGTYEGRTDKDERGNYGVARVTVKNEKITNVVFTEYTEDNKAKARENGYDYEPTLKAIKDLPQELMEKQDVLKVDTYSGATGTTNKFKTAVMNALAKGKQKSK